MTSLRRLLAVVLWHAGFAPSERIQRQTAAITYIETSQIPAAMTTAVPSSVASRIEACSETGCWVWIAARDRHGYGKVRTERSSAGLAHRFVFELVRGPIPAGMQLDHLCRNRACVNPQHLEPVTNRENLLRGETLAAANAAKTRCPHGHPYDNSNTRVDKHGKRYCRQCDREAWVKRRARAAELAAPPTGSRTVGAPTNEGLAPLPTAEPVTHERNPHEHNAV